MVLGLRSKSRKRVSTQVHYVIHVREIKPWPPSQLLRSAQSVLLQWENSDKNSGSFASISSNGKIEFNKSFRLPVTLWKKASKKGTQHGKFQKNCLEFHLYECQNEKAVKSQLLGSATIKLADFGIIKQTTAISTQVSCKRRFRNSAQAILYVIIEPFDVESFGSSPKSSLSRELSLDKEESESTLQSVNEGNDEDLGIASFTDSDDDDADDDSSSTSSQTVRSAYETTGDSSQISEGGTSGFNGEFNQPLETSATFLVKEEVGTSKQLNGIRYHSSDMGTATNDRCSLSKLPEESGRLADSSYKVPENIKQPKRQIKGVLDKVVASPSYIPVGLQTNLESSSQSQVTEEDSITPKDIGRGQGFNGEFNQPLETSATFLVKEEVGTSKQLNGIRYHSSDMGNVTNDRSSLSKLPEESDRLADSSYKVPESIEQPNKQIKGALDKVVTSAYYNPVGLQTNLESSSQSQVTKEDSIIPKDIGRGQGFNGEFVQPLETSATFLVKEEVGTSKQLNGISSHSSDMGNATNDISSLSKLPEEGGKLADSSYKVPESIEKPKKQIKGILDKVVTSPSYIPVVLKTNLESSSQSQVTKEGSKIPKDIGRRQGFNGEFVQPLETSATFLVKEEVGTSKQLNGIRSHSSDMGNATNDRSSLSKLPEESGRLADSSYKVPESIEQPNKQIKGILDKGVTSSSCVPVGLQTNLESSSQSQVTKEDTIILNNIGRGQGYNTCGKEKVGGVFKTDILVEDQDGKEKKGKGQEEQINKKPVKNELVHNFPGDDFRKKGEIKIATLPLSRISNEWPKNVMMNEKLDDVATVKLPLDAAEGYELFSKSQAQDQEEKINTLKDVHASVVCHPATDMNESLAQDREEKINTLKDVHVSAVCHPATDMNDNIPNNRTKLKSEVQMLREELRVAAALEVSLYSVVAEHGSSANKVHAPARRLSRFYFHAYRAGIPATRASAAQSAVSGFVLVSKACGNDVPRLTFWFSNLILLRIIVRKGLKKMPNAYGLCFSSEHDGRGLVDRSSLRSSPYLDEKMEIGVENFCNWEDPQTFLIALEKVEAWIFSRIVESVWWQTLTPHMQPAAAKSSSSRKFYGRKNGLGDQQQGSFSNDLWKRAFKDACERLCPLRAGGLECGCLPVIARLVMEQLVNRLDVAMFNAILRESDEEMPTDPISDPISDSKVLPIPAGKSGFGAGAQLKNAIGNWSRWLSDLFGIDDSDPPEDSNENEDNKSSESETSFKVFHLLNALSDLMMLPFEMLADSSSRKEVCPRFGVQLIKRVLNNFVPDEFCLGPIPDAVFDALNAEDIQDEEGSITNVPCTAASIIYSTPPAASVMGILQDVGTHTPNRSGSSVLKKSYTSDDELDDLDSPLLAIGIDDLSLASKFSAGKQGRRVVRYELLREAWRDSE